MTVWYTEKHTPHSGITMEVEKSVFQGESSFQSLQVLDTYDFGRILLLDGLVMLTERDEFVYHEMIAHVPLNTHPAPKRVLVIGGGDGGTVREVLKHPQVREVTLVEIDRMVVEVSKEYLPGVSGGFADPRTRIVFDNGVKFIAGEPPGSYDVILVDSTDPVGPAQALFSEDFFRDCFTALSPEGVFVTQSESPFQHLSFMVDTHRCMGGVFPRRSFYLAPVPTYPGGTWSFLLACKVDSGSFPRCRECGDLPTRYYNHGIHMACFEIPRFLEEALNP